ncbi:MAG TPA: hypothetical protein VNR36_11040 [Pseudolysinimonas sp.]|nr:hypothetical protein [Pseudolysinimonas sp.]
MPQTDSDAARWAQARAAAAALAETGIDPLDVSAARAARTALVRRFVLDLLTIFGVVAVVAAIGLMVFRAFAGDDPLGGREIWIGSAALLFLLVVVAARSFLPAARAYEAAWAAFVERVWPGTPKGGDELGAARLAFVRAHAEDAAGAFPSVAPGRRKG